ncbi:hypothetical protein COE03_31215, partial [Bacillus thuringiensis]
MKIKQIKKVAPLAVLSTAILFSPTNSFAAEQPTKGLAEINMMQNTTVKSGENVVDLQTIKKDIVNRLKANWYQNFTGDYLPPGLPPYDEYIEQWTPQFTNTDGHISIPEVNIDSLTPTNIELGSYANKTNVVQKLVTDETTETVTNSFTNTDTNSEKLGLNTETKVDVEIPFVADGGETIKTTTEFTFTQSSSNTETNTTSVKYPSQTLECEPGYITSLV